MSHIVTVANDFRGLQRVCGSALALRWLKAIALNARTILKNRNLQAADRAVGKGPFEIRCASSKFSVCGEGIFSGIRDMYARDVYLNGGLLQIKDGDVVVDLGANIGNFTNLALSYGKNVKVIAVEPSSGLNAAFMQSVGRNPGYLERTTLIRAFLGHPVPEIVSCTGDDPNYAGAVWLTEDELIEEAGIFRLDFLKCDIEGGEFGLLHPGSRLLSMTKSLAAEVHHFAGDVDGFIRMLTRAGFDILADRRAPGGSTIVLAKRPS